MRNEKAHVDIRKTHFSLKEKEYFLPRKYIITNINSIVDEGLLG